MELRYVELRRGFKSVFKFTVELRRTLNHILIEIVSTFKVTVEFVELGRGLGESRCGLKTDIKSAFKVVGIIIIMTEIALKAVVELKCGLSPSSKVSVVGR